MSNTKITEKQLEKLQNCSRHANKTIYFCNFPGCPFREQSYYCEECMVPERHDHLPGRLHLLVQKILEQWTTTNIAISTKVDEAKVVYTLFEPIIKYLNAVG